MPNHKSRPAGPSSSSRSRSNSLQRMLELEKQYMLDRMHPGNAGPIATNGPKTKKSPAALQQHGASAVADKQAPWPQPQSRRPLKEAASINNHGVSQAQAPAPNKSQAQPGSHPQAAHHPSQPRHPPRTHARSDPPQLKLDLHLPPLSISSGQYRAPDVRRDTSALPPPSPPRPVQPVQPVKPVQPAKPAPKVAPVDQPPDDGEELRSTCQSPSWEAYGRRRKEKKEKKEEEKREKEQLEKDRARGRQLIRKPNPSQTPTDSPARTPNPTQTLDQKPRHRDGSVSGSHLALPSAPAPQKQRPASILGLPTPPPIKDEGSGRRSRSRSGSFSSLFKVGFDRRRASVDDPSSDAGFIGGVKLDQQRRASHQKTPDDQPTAAEANIHPALRNSPPNLGSPAHFDSPLPRSPADPNRRAYPPITRQPAPSKLRSADAAPDESMISKWRARVGLKPSAKKSPPESKTKLEGLSVADGDALKKVISAPMAPVDALEKEMGETIESKKIAAAVPPNKDAEESKDRPVDQREAEKRRSHIRIEEPETSVQSYKSRPAIDTDAPRSSGEEPETGTSLSPPPAPPRKSSKRNSTMSLQAARPSPTRETASRSSSQSPDQPPHDLNGASIGGMPVPKVVTPAGEWSDSAASPWGSSRRTHTSSDEDSYSEDLRSHSPASTPDTSRPQSEKGLTPILPDTEKRFALEDLPQMARHAANKSTSAVNLSGHSARATHPETEGDAIQAAARKVMAAFPNLTPPQRPSMDRRSQSDPDMTRESRFLPKLKNRVLPSKERSKPVLNLSATVSTEDGPSSPPLRDLILTKDQSSAAAPWPATYLEAARKAAPAAPVPRIVPGGSSARNSLPPPQQPLSPTSGGNSRASGLGIGAHAQGADGGADPLAKMFVECCSCRYYHDMPSRVYAAMANPGGVVGDAGLEGAISMTVKCPWCKHDMSTKCCAGLAALVYVKERLH